MTKPDGSHHIAHSSHGDWLGESIHLVSDDGPVDEITHRFVCRLRDLVHRLVSSADDSPGSVNAEDVLTSWSYVAESFPAPWTSWVEGRDGAAFDSFILTGEEQGRGLDLYVRCDGSSSRRDHIPIQDFLAAAVNHLGLLAVRAPAEDPG